VGFLPGHDELPLNCGRLAPLIRPNPGAVYYERNHKRNRERTTRAPYDVRLAMGCEPEEYKECQCIPNEACCASSEQLMLPETRCV
jgi:hypothetical protein